MTPVSKDILLRSHSSFQVLWNSTSGGDQARSLVPDLGVGWDWDSKDSGRVDHPKTKAVHVDHPKKEKRKRKKNTWEEIKDNARKVVKAHFFFPIVHWLSLTLTHEHWRECSYFFRKSKSWWSEQSKCQDHVLVSQRLCPIDFRAAEDGRGDGELLIHDSWLSTVPEATTYNALQTEVVASWKMRSWRSTFV